jgi:hypothetical protein
MKISRPTNLILVWLQMRLDTFVRDLREKNSKVLQNVCFFNLLQIFLHVYRCLLAIKKF